MVKNIEITNILQAISEAYLSITQDVSQGVYALQMVSLDCGGETSENCLSCISSTKKLTNDSKIISDTCKPVCDCSISNIDLSQQISVNFSSFMENSSEADFQSKLLNSIYIQAQQTNNPLNFQNKMTEITNNINIIYNEMRTESFQNSIQSLKSTQIVSLKGAGNITTVNQQFAIDFISNILMSNSTISKAASELTNSVINSTYQVINAGLNKLISLIVQGFFLFFIIIILFFIIQQSFQIYNLVVI